MANASPATRWLQAFPTRVRQMVPGLSVVILVAAAATGVSHLWTTLSPLVVAVVLGALIANLITVPASWQPGISFAARTLLRLGIVLLGLRLSLSDLSALGWRGLAGVIVVVLATFFGTQLLARWLGIKGHLGLLVATGYSICGASAIAAVNRVADADEEETAYALALVTLCGSLSIAVLPSLRHVLGFDAKQFGSWVGGAVHDVGQVVATAATSGRTAVESATLVKLTRVVMLAPMIAGVTLWRRRSATAEPSPTKRSRQPIIPLFIAGFLLAVVIRSTDVLSATTISRAADLEKLVLTVALAGLGFGVRLSRLRRLGGKPLVLGLLAWVLVAGMAYLDVRLIGAHS